MLEVVRMNTSFGDRSFAAAAPRVWNSLPDAVHNSALSEDAFAKLLKTSYLNGRGAFDVEFSPLNKLIIIIIIIYYGSGHNKEYYSGSPLEYASSKNKE